MAFENDRLHDPWFACRMRGVRMACPDETKITELLARSLAASTAARIEAHLADCDDCRNLVFALASSGGEPAAGAESTVERIGRFEIVDVVGRGAMGIVYRARDPELDRTVAIKVRRSQAKLAVDADDRLQREARALARLTHPNVVAVYEAGRDAGLTYVAMEYVDGVTLDRWLATPRSLEDVVSTLAGAGRGLAAAHAAGLVHRDFKPHNVFVGDGVAKVGDFGLVRAEPGGELPEELTMTLSVTGAIVGTPAYMAPEQLRGEPATEASDQFSFCVTLFEAIYGKRPFIGSTLPQLLAAMSEPLELPTTPRVRPALKQALRRGLAYDASERFPSMTALLDLLAKRRPVKRWVAAATLVAVATATAGTLLASEVEDPCAVRDERAVRVFAPARAAAIAEAFVATRARAADSTAQRIGTVLNAYGKRWFEASATSCRATAQGRQSSQLGDRQRACLERRLHQADELASVLASVKEETAVSSATSAVLALPDPDACTRADLGDREPPPAGTAAEVQRVERQLDRISGLYQTGQVQSAGAEIDDAVKAARATAYSPLVARALIVQSAVHAGSNRFDQIELLLDEAAREAAKGRDDRLAAEAWIRRVYAVGVHGSRYEDAQQWARAAEAALLRAGNPADLRAGLHMNLGTLYIETDKLAEGEKELLAAIDLRTNQLPHDPLRLSDAHNNLAALLQRQNKMDDAERHFLKSLELSRSVHGDEHPDIIETYVNLGFLFSEREQPERALEYLDKARTLGETVLGADHVTVGITLDTMGLARVSLGQYDEAAKLHRRAYEIMLANLGAKHRRTGFALGNLGRAAQRLGDYAAAITAYKDAAKVLADALGPTHDIVSRVHTGLGTVYRLSGDLDAAKREYEHALKMLEDKKSAEAVIPRFNLAQLALERGDCNAARKDLEIAAAQFGRVSGDPSTLTAEAGLVYCDAVQKRRDKARLASFEAAVAAAPLESFEPHTAAFIHYARARGVAATGDKSRAKQYAMRSHELYGVAKLTASQKSVEEFMTKGLR